jgi:hypothetical protein
MSGIVNEDDLSALAAEYVIGTLDPEERERANALLDVDEGFRALVRTWERRLGELHLMVEPVEPDGEIWDRIRGRLGMRTPVPPPFAPQLAPAGAPISAPLSAPPVSAPLSAAAFSASAPEPSFELESEPEPIPHAPPHWSTPPSWSPQPTSPPPFPSAGQRTPEQELASLIAEADKFTTQLAELATAPPKAAPDSVLVEPPAEPQVEPPVEPVSPVLHAESLLSEAADAITTKPAEPQEAEPVEEPWPEEPAAVADVPPPVRGPRHDSTSLLSPADVARLTVRRQQARIGRWRATALLMAFLALGLGSLIATWRFAPDRLPQRLQPIAVLGLGDWTPSERSPAEHGTQFEE